jgi:hypothetical protein
VEDSEKIKNRTLYDPAISLLGLHPKKLKSGSWRDTFSPILTKVLFAIGKMPKQHKCPSVGKWIKKMCYIHSLAYYSQIQFSFNLMATEWLTTDEWVSTHLKITCEDELTKYT